MPITVVGTPCYVMAGWPHQAQLPPLSLGFVSLVRLVVMAPVPAFAAPFGARLSHKLSRRRLEIALACFVPLVGARFLLAPL